jgi:hypothetical protein
MEFLFGMFLMVAFFASWIVPLILGVKWAKRNRVSPHWMWFGLHPLGAWIAFPIIRWGSEISKVNGTAIKWVTGKVACTSCGRFNPMNNAFCAECGMPTLKPTCPRCQADKTRFVGHVGRYIGWAILLMVIGGFIPNSSENLRTVGKVITNEDLLVVLLAVLFFLASLVFFFRPLSRNTKRIKCISCGTESSVSNITAFHQLAAQGTSSYRAAVPQEENKPITIVSQVSEGVAVPLPPADKERYLSDVPDKYRGLASAIKQWWHDDAQTWWSTSGQQVAYCDDEGEAVAQGQGFKTGRRLLCERCADERLTKNIVWDQAVRDLDKWIGPGIPRHLQDNADRLWESPKASSTVKFTMRIGSVFDSGIGVMVAGSPEGQPPRVGDSVEIIGAEGVQKAHVVDTTSMGGRVAYVLEGVKGGTVKEGDILQG